MLALWKNRMRHGFWAVMRRVIFSVAASACVHHTYAQAGFLQQQKKYPRVRAALAAKEEILDENLHKYGLAAGNIHILMIAYKAEQQLEMYAKAKNAAVYQKIATYRVCATSGTLGPKRRKGDGQVPEGFYTVQHFNPASNFYLSIGINYPNVADRRRNLTVSNLGGDIFIHGACVTIGCLPMTDDKIMEIYLYATYARENNQRDIPVYIFPFRMTDSNLQKYKERYAKNRELTGFWTNLKAGYDAFSAGYKALNVSVDRIGEYRY